MVCQNAKMCVGSGLGSFEKNRVWIESCNANKKLLNFLIPVSYNADKFGLKH